MKNLKFLFLFVFYFAISYDLFAKQNEILDIRLNTEKNNERIVIESKNKINFNAFLLRSPYRLVVDLQNTSTGVKAPSFKSNNVVDQVRIGKFSEYDTRLVFDLNIKVNLDRSFYLAPTSSNPLHRIVVDLSFNSVDLQNEDLIGKLIEENNLYDVEPNILNSLIDDILAENNNNNKNLNNLIDEILVENYEEKNLGTIKKVSSTSKPKVIATKSNVAKYNVSKTNNRKPRIIIDAGHGGKDPGTIGTRGTKEKIITLTYAKSLKQALDKTNKYKTYMTRSQDFYVELRERVSIARRYKGDLFISIHADSSPSRDARGISIYTLSQTASDTRTAKLAQKENKADIIGGLNLYGEYQDTINTLVDISRHQAMNDSKIFAKILKEQFTKKNIKGLGNMVKHANFAVLTSADMPSVLLELGFLSNKTDERMIRSYGYKTKVVNSIVNAINLYFKSNPIN